MTRLSRPFQLALGAVAVLALVWFVALGGRSTRSTSSNSSASPPAAPAQSSPSAGAHAAAPTPVYHGSAPGVEGLSKAIASAHAAVAKSQQNAKQLEAASARASSASVTGSSSEGSSSGPQPSSSGSEPSSGGPLPTLTNPTSPPASSARKSAPAVQPSPPRSTAARSHSSVTVHASAGHHTGSPATVRVSVSGAGAPARQALVESALHEGKLALLLFWNPQGIVDSAVRAEVRSVPGKVAVFEAGPEEVASFGSFTRNIQVYATPTVLIVNQRGQVRTITGFTDTYAIEQAIGEAKAS